MNVLITTLRLPMTIEQAWEFFSRPENLQKITPPDMQFKITSEMPQKMYAGMIITYTVRPLFNIPVQWMTEITHIEAQNYFIDNQKSGPFRIWHHQHHFREIEGGVEMTDIVNYAAPFGFLGRIAERLVVERRVKGIFEFRKKRLEEMFGTF